MNRMANRKGMDGGLSYDGLYEHHSQARIRRKHASRRKARDPVVVARKKLSLEAAHMRLRARHQAEAQSVSWWRFIERMRYNKDRDAAAIYRDECAIAWREQLAPHMAARNAAIAARFRKGFVWCGGAVGGNSAYQTAPLCYIGLASDHHPILRLFVSKLPRGRSLICGNDKASADPAPHGSKLLGCDKAYIEGLKSMRGFLRVEIDRSLPFEDIAMACQKAGIPQPNIAAGSRDATGSICNPHLIWLLENSVAFTPRGGLRFKNLFQRVLKGLTAALLPWGADPGGICNSMRVKNPLSPLWQRHIYAEAPYALADLRDCVDMTVSLPKAGLALVPRLDHPDLEVAAGSNVVFRYLTAWARQEVRLARDEQRISQDEWRLMVEAQAWEWMRQAAPPRAHGRKDASRNLIRLSRQVADWNWLKIRPARKVAPLPAADVAVRQAAAGRATGAKRAAGSQASILAAAMALRALGKGVTQVAVWTALDDSGTALSLRTVERHWEKVTEALNQAA
jgi:hypothetical protein